MRVRPGVDEVFASPLKPVRVLSSDDLPTFERPAKATSGGPGGGKPSGETAEMRKVAWRARMAGASSHRQHDPGVRIDRRHRQRQEPGGAHAPRARRPGG